MASIETVGTPAISARHQWPIAYYIARRIAAAFLILLIATILIFGAIQILPGNVAEIVLGRNRNPQRLAEVNAALHSDSPLALRYVEYLSTLLHGDMGVSTAGLVQGVQTPLSAVVVPALTNSLILAALALLLFVPTTLMLGVISGVRAGKPIDHVISTTTLAIGALPEFLVGTGLTVVFFTKLGLLSPVSSIPAGQSPLRHLDLLVLPVLTLQLVSLSFGARLLRASVVEVMTQDYIMFARLNGYSSSRIIFRYLLPNGLVATIQIIAQQTQYLIGGVVVVESVFNYPGIGNLLVRAISVRDVQEIMVVSTILAAIYVVTNIVADVVCVLIDPKARTSL